MASKERPSALMDDIWSAYQMRGYGQLLDPYSEQAIECKRAFYAGAFNLIALLTGMASPGDEPTEDDMSAVDQAMDEITAFFESESAIHKARGH